VLFYGGLRYLHRNFPVIGAMMSERVLFLLFGFLMVMLVLSNAISGFSTLFRNRETEWLLSRPAAHRDVYRWKSLESMVLASWAFVFLLVPLMAAYGAVMKLGLAFYLWLIALLVPFVLVPSVLGMALLMVFVRLLRYRWVIPAILAGSAAFLAALWWVARPVDPDSLMTVQDTRIFGRLLQNTRFLMNPLWPSYWLSTSILAACDGLWGKAWFYFMVILANALMAALVSFRLLSLFFYSAWERVQCGRAGAAAVPRGELGAGTGFAVAAAESAGRLAGRFLPPHWRALLIKDIKVFLRDPVQWSQFLIFFGLLWVYILNLRQTTYDLATPFWRNIVVYLNLAASSMTLATLTTRFVFPQFSMEGKRLWLVGLSPAGLRGVVWEKFALCWTFSGLITLGLTLTSCLVIGMTALHIAGFCSAIVLMSAALSGLAVGIGVLYPNFKQDNPSAIVSGFGGTFCLVMSFLYIVLVLAFLLVPAQLPLMTGMTGHHAPEFFMKLRLGGQVLTVAASLVATALPLWLALRRVDSIEI